jgi:hypothetical protein
VYNVFEGMFQYRKKWRKRVARMHRDRLPLWDFQFLPSGRRDLRGQNKDGKTSSIFEIKMNVTS